jgi:hypothetical protein
MTADRTKMHLQLAFSQPGCALCRVRDEAEHSYVLSLLGERFSDEATRRRLRSSLGLCRSHAWALQAAERQVGRTGMATGMLYHSLVEHVLECLMSHLDHRPLRQQDAHRSGSDLLHTWRRLKRWWHRQQGPVPLTQIVDRLSPRVGCPACEVGAATEATAVRRLAADLAADLELRAGYVASDGLCLPHLRRVLEEMDDADSFRIVAEKAVHGLGILEHNLSEFIRKHSWQYHEESRSAQEQAAWIRAIAFMAGEAPAGVEEFIQAARCEAQLAHHHLPPSTTSGEERATPDSPRSRI